MHQVIERPAVADVAAGRILMIGDDARLLSTLREILVGHGYSLDVAWFEQGLQGTVDEPPDVAILALSQRAIDQRDICLRLRKAVSAPICIISTSTSPAAVAAGLSGGADTYISMPCDEPELLARLRALIRRVRRRKAQADSDIIRVGEIEIDLTTRCVRRRGVPVEMSPTEYRLLEVLARNRGRVLTHRQLLATVWGPEYIDDTQHIRLYIRYLRTKLEDDPNQPRYILTHWGIGYQFADPRMAMRPMELHAVAG